MCIECKIVEHYVPRDDNLMLQVDTVNNKPKKCGPDKSPELDSEERESEDSGTVASTGADTFSS